MLQPTPSCDKNVYIRKPSLASATVESTDGNKRVAGDLGSHATALSLCEDIIALLYLEVNLPVTFDTGYRSNLHLYVALLRNHGIVDSRGLGQVSRYRYGRPTIAVGGQSLRATFSVDAIERIYTPFPVGSSYAGQRSLDV